MRVWEEAWYQENESWNAYMSTRADIDREVALRLGTSTPSHESVWLQHPTRPRTLDDGSVDDVEDIIN